MQVLKEAGRAAPLLPTQAPDSAKEKQGEHGKPDEKGNAGNDFEAVGKSRWSPVFDAGLSVAPFLSSASVRFTKPGTYRYICTPHPSMKGTISSTR